LYSAISRDWLWPAVGDGAGAIFWEAATAVNTRMIFWGPPEEYGFVGRLGNSENLGPHRGLQPSQLTPSASGTGRFFGENRIFP
jgi:hypothetical protein